MSSASELPHWLTRIGVFDLETTGIDVESDRIVTAHVGVLDSSGHEFVSKDWLADPASRSPTAPRPCTG